MNKQCLHSKFEQEKRLLVFLVTLLLTVFIHTNIYAQTNASDTVELATIKNLIKETRAQLSRNLADSERLQQELKLAELQIAETATLLNETDKNLSDTREEINALTAEKTKMSAQISAQQRALKSQVKSAYMAGDYDFAKMIFNQDQAGKFERTLTYYQYLNKARQTHIENFRGLISALETVKQELDQKEMQLIELSTRQSDQSKSLSSQQQARFAKFRALEKQIESDQAKVNNLEQQENDLLSAIEQAELSAKRAREQADAQGVELVGLAGKEKQLMKPASGAIQRLFGKRRQGQIRWKGIIINAKSGTPVKAVSDGVVLYADWLKGFGLVTIVDHGKGYMSVYGSNQALLKNVGDTVFAGQNISLIGTSGGQEKAGLYFEIRHKGKALNPSKWLLR